jgi:signal transduction histidine kinase
VFPVFHSARLKLTLAYTVGIALIMAAFSVALYIVLAGNIDIPGSGTERADQAIQAAQLARIRLVIAAVNVAGWVLAAGVAYVIAGRTLRPIAAALARQRQFTAHASHELRTPLTVMKGEIDVSLARERAPEQYRETLSRIDAEVVHLEQMVADLLDLAELDARQETLNRECRAVGDVLREVVEPLTPQLSQHRLHLVVDIPAPLEANLDWTRVRHLARNLVENAIQHTPPLGEIRISGRQRGKDLELIVFNTGAPIADSDLPHLFVPFYRGKGSDPDGGTGLGLALSDWVARAHGGSIMAQNCNGGVSFIVRLPAA